MLDLEQNIGINPPKNELLENQVESNIRQLGNVEQGLTRMALACGQWTQEQIIQANFLPKMLPVVKTAIHEIGHNDIVKMIGGIVERISVIPNGRQLGVTYIRLPFWGSMLEHYTRLMATYFGGQIAEAKFGISHEGCGADMGAINSIAKALASRFSFVSAGSLIGDAYSLAHRALSAISNPSFLSRSFQLAARGSASSI